MNPNQILQYAGGVVGRTARISEQVGLRVLRDGYGLVRRARHIRQQPKPSMDDVTLARKVETEIFRASRAPKSTVNVNVVDGVVWLRGEVKRADQIRSLERKAQSVPEVLRVENLLHLPKTPAPTRADTPRRQQRTRSSTKRPTPRRQTGGRVTDDRTDALVADREPSPAEHAQQSTGRTPPPFGSEETGPDDADRGAVGAADVGGGDASPADVGGGDATPADVGGGDATPAAVVGGEANPIEAGDGGANPDLAEAGDGHANPDLTEAGDGDAIADDAGGGVVHPVQAGGGED